MFKNYLKIAVRNLLKSKSFSFINITGLAVGMAGVILILLWMQNELSIDQYHENKDRIYAVWNKAVFDGKIQCWSVTPKPLAAAMKQDYPEIEQVTRKRGADGLLLTVKEKKLVASGSFVDSNFLNVFTFPLVQGNKNSVLKNMSSIVITEKLAKRLFGNEDPMNKTILIDSSDNFTVTGVLKDLPNTTDFAFDYLIPWSYSTKLGWDDQYWGNNSVKTYAELKPGVNIAAFGNKVKDVTKRHSKNEEDVEVFLHPMAKWHLYSSFENGKIAGGKIVVVRMFGLIALFILVIACINFMNLSTARSEKRAKEVGIRKVVGAGKKLLIGQFIGESVLLSFIAGLFALLLVQLSLGAFNDLVNKQLYVPYASPWFWLSAIAFILITGLLAGSYPAFYLSSFKPVSILKGTFKSSGALVTPRKVLVVLQFSFAISLIISTIIVQKQIVYAQQRQSGYVRDGIVYTFLKGDLEKNYSLVRNELLSSGAVTSVTKTSAPLTEGWSNSWGIGWEGKEPNSKIVLDRYVADNNIVKTAGFKLVAGRDFDLDAYKTDSLGIILNESAVKVMGFKDPIGKIVKDNGRDWHVVGVIQDFILQSPYQPTVPMVIEGAMGWFNVIHMRLNGANSATANMAKVEAIFKKYNPAYPFDYRFIDEEYAQKFDGEKRTAKFVGLFAALTIFISCLGLFGLAAYMAENRVKEIGVRKVLGASIFSITTLLSKDFVKLVVIAILIASPMAWYGMNKWLDGYAYRIQVSWWLFAMAGFGAIFIALITVSYQSVKAAMANPVKSLRSE
ncbi:MAG: ABC transporter permease [Filimonas sp.]|nr:ABC transporter permease [Filimonas sp.]